MNNFFIFLDEVTSITGMECGGEPVLQVIKFVMNLLDVIFFLVPIGLIVMVSLDLLKNVIAGKMDDMKKNLNMAIKRVLMAVALFLVDPIVTFSIGLLEENGVDFAGCIEIALNDDLSQYKIELSDEDYDPIDTNLKSPSGLVPSTSSSANAADIIEKATSWMEKIAKDDDNYGYCNNKELDDMYGGKGYNCIGLVAMGWDYAGVKGAGKTWDFSHIKEEGVEAGFRDVTNDVNLDTGENLRRGDVLVRDVKKNDHWHMAQYVGDGKLVEAVGPGTKSDCDKGDSTGGEIHIRSYYNDDWTIVFRYVGGELTTDDDNETSTSTSSGESSTEKRTTIFVGDSRFVGMKTVVGNRENQEWICETGKGYTWLKGTAYAKITGKIESDKKYNIVINLGVNDPDNVGNYKKIYGQMTRSSVFDNSNIYIVSVNPIDSTLAKKNGYQISNDDVIAFNKKMAAIGDVDGITYCDTYSTLIEDGYSTSDGVHYQNVTYYKIYNEIMNNCIK